MLNYEYVDNMSKLDDAMDYLSRKKRIGFDTETNGLDPIVSKVLLIQIGDRYRQFVFDVHKLETGIQQVVNYLLQPGVEKIGHFLQFDYGMMKTNFGVDLPNLVCTHVGTSLLTKGIISADNSLYGCLDKYLGIKIDKDEQKSFENMKLGDEFTEGQIEYAAIDVEHMLPLKDNIQELIDSRGMKQLYELENETVRVCGDMGVNGIYLDSDMWLALRDKARKDMEKAQAKLDKYFIPHLSLDIFGKPNINYNSQQQLLPVLKKITGQVIKDTQESTLQQVDHAVIPALWDYRKAVKKITTYGEEFIKKHVHPVTGRVHSNFRQLGTDSGRMASRDPKHVGVYKLGELLETLQKYWGNQQRSLEYILETFRDYLRPKAVLITGFSAQ